jgi:hypothetical protein
MNFEVFFREILFGNVPDYDIKVIKLDRFQTFVNGIKRKIRGTVYQTININEGIVHGANTLNITLK